MLTQYLRAAMDRAQYETLDDDGSFFGSIPELQGVWANAPSMDECRSQLEEVLEDWLMLSLAKNLPIPSVQGIELRVHEVA